MTQSDRKRARALTAAAVELRPGRTGVEVINDLVSAGLTREASGEAIRACFDAGTVARDKDLRLVPGPRHRPDPGAAAELADLLIKDLCAVRDEVAERIRALVERRKELRIRADSHKFGDFS